MSEASEAAWAKFWNSEEPDYEGIASGFDAGWAAALEWAAGKSEERAKEWREEARNGGAEWKERARKVASELEALGASLREAQL